MWGLSLLTLCFGLITTLKIPIIVIKKLDIGVQNNTVSKFLDVRFLLFGLSRFLKSLKIFLVIIIIWLLVYMSYYLNNNRPQLL